METIYPHVLILSSRFDLSCDFVTARLFEFDIPFVRLNSEDLNQLQLKLDPIGQSLTISNGTLKYEIAPRTLRSVYFRRPVYLREFGVPFDIDEQHSRTQWAAFMRNMMIFKDCFWMNHPRATYYAEHKAIQLLAAHQLGFSVPKTTIQNSGIVAEELLNSNLEVMIKGLDTVLARNVSTEIFGFSQVVGMKELLTTNTASAPITIQEFLNDKLDIRVTVIEGKTFAVTIREDGGNVLGDWRLRKKKLTFEHIALPDDVVNRCVLLVRQFDLSFGAIDLALVNGIYHFLEVNPTGEWAWLLDSAQIRIDHEIANALGRLT